MAITIQVPGTEKPNLNSIVTLWWIDNKKNLGFVHRIYNTSNWYILLYTVLTVVDVGYD